MGLEEGSLPTASLCLHGFHGFAHGIFFCSSVLTSLFLHLGTPSLCTALAVTLLRPPHGLPGDGALRLLSQAPGKA